MKSAKCHIVNFRYFLISKVVELMFLVEGGIFNHSQKWFLPQLTRWKFY